MSAAAPTGGSRQARGTSRVPLLVGAVVVSVATALTLLVEGPASPYRHAYVVPVAAAALRFGAAGGWLGALSAVMLQAPALLARIEQAGLASTIVDDLLTAITLLLLGPLLGACVDEARRQRERSETLLAVQAALSDEAPLPVALARVRACLAIRLRADVALAAGEGDSLAIAGAERLPPESLAARAWRSGQMVFVPDAGGGLRPRRVIATPLVAGSQVIGVLAVEREGEIPGRERATLTALGVHVGLALENARLAARQRRFSTELEERVRAATDRLVALDRAKSAFVALASHELRTPLTALRGFSELLVTRRFAPGEVRRLAGILRRETERLARIIDDFLDLARLEQGVAPRLQQTAVEVAAMVAATAELFSAGGGTHTLRVDVEPELPSVYADPDALARILGNLVSNAIKYSPAGSGVTLRARRAPGAVAFSVEDEGPGIAAEARPRLFEPYFRTADAERVARGAGLGLAVVKALVDAHGGAIHVESEPGRGTRITVEVPAVP